MHPAGLQARTQGALQAAQALWDGTAGVRRSLPLAAAFGAGGALALPAVSMLLSPAQSAAAAWWLGAATLAGAPVSLCAATASALAGPRGARLQTGATLAAQLCSGAVVAPWLAGSLAGGAWLGAAVLVGALLPLIARAAIEQRLLRPEDWMAMTAVVACQLALAPIGWSLHAGAAASLVAISVAVRAGVVAIGLAALHCTAAVFSLVAPTPFVNRHVVPAALGPSEPAPQPDANVQAAIASLQQTLTFCDEQGPRWPDMPMLALVGRHGDGKTTAARSIARALDADLIVLDAATLHQYESPQHYAPGTLAYAAWVQAQMRATRSRRLQVLLIDEPGSWLDSHTELSTAAGQAKLQRRASWQWMRRYLRPLPAGVCVLVATSDLARMQAAAPWLGITRTVALAEPTSHALAHAFDAAFHHALAELVARHPHARCMCNEGGSYEEHVGPMRRAATALPQASLRDVTAFAARALRGAEALFASPAAAPSEAELWAGVQAECQRAQATAARLGRTGPAPVAAAAQTEALAWATVLAAAAAADPSTWFQRAWLSLRARVDPLYLGDSARLTQLQQAANDVMWRRLPATARPRLASAMLQN